MQATNEQMEKMTSTYVQTATDMNAMLRDTINATLESVSIMTKGCSDLCNCMSALMQKQLEQNVKISQTMMSTKDVTSLVGTQNSVIKDSIESMMSDMSNITQLSTRIAQEAAAPVTKQVNASICKLSQTQAA